MSETPSLPGFDQDDKKQPGTRFIYKIYMIIISIINLI